MEPKGTSGSSETMPRFKTRSELMNWLATSKEGQEIVRLIDRPRAVLVEVERDGFVNVYGSEGTKAHIFNRPDLGDASLEDRYVQRFRMPQNYKRLHSQGKIIETGQVRADSLADICEIERDRIHMHAFRKHQWWQRPIEDPNAR